MTADFAPRFLDGALALAGGMLSASTPARNKRDSLGIDLPPLYAGASLSPEMLAVVASLYLFSELEGAGVVLVAEAIVDERYQLAVADESAALLLENMARARRDFIERGDRDAIYARLFGIGAGATLAGAGNHNFIQSFASLCTALSRIADEARMTSAARPGLIAPQPSVAASAQVRTAVLDVLGGLSAHVAGDLVYTSRRLHQQLVAALQVLGNRAVAALFRARDARGVIAAVVGADAPDFAACVGRGTAGQQLLLWLRTQIGAAGPAAPSVLHADDSAVAAAISWLAAAGVNRAATAAPAAWGIS